MKNRPTWQLIVLSLLLLWALIAQLTFIGFVLYLKINSGRYLRVPFTTDAYTTIVSALRPNYENSGLRIGDEALALNGEPVRGAEQIEAIRSDLRPGDTLVVTVRRIIDGNPRTLDIPVRMHRYSDSSLSWTTILALRIFLPLSCILVGFYIAFARPRDPLAWITLGMLASFGELLGRAHIWAVWSPWRELALVYFSILNFAWPLWMLLFAFHFPISFPFTCRRPWVNWVVALPFIFFSAIWLYGDLMEGNHIHEIAKLANFSDRIENPLRIFFSACVFAFFYLLGAKKHILTAADARRRMNVMIWGCSVALFPLFFVILSELGAMPPLPGWVITLCLLMLVFFPITMMYVIIVQRAMDVRMVVRTGARYALASTGVKVLRFVLIAATIVYTIQRGVMTRHVSEAILIGCVGAGVAIFLRRLSGRILRWMDRRFFREAYDAEMILTDLSNSVAGFRDRKALLETVAQRISDSLHVDRIAILLERGGAYEPAYALGFNGECPAVELDRNAAAVRLLKRDLSPSKVFFDDPQSWVHGVSESEQTALQTLEAQLLLPVSLRNRLLGVISLSPKKSEAPYSKGDLQLLGAVASQTGLALENAELTENIRREIAQRERHDRELEIARDVQQRLFPQTTPCVNGLDIAGYCRPALGVGGDYYDFIHLPDGCLGLAIGDVSGKGIAAALMMASLQASLRGQTIKPSETLSEMIHHINRLVYEASADNRYATFFYAQYDPVQRLLRYVNAGHNPPMVIRGKTDEPEIFRLEDGGTVVGLLPDFPYRDARIWLQHGDIFVGFTDGISEAMDNFDVEFDEARLIAAVRECESLSAAGMITGILERVDAFTAGAPQHDDMTLVVMRVQ
jgi:phosphoserine phosphatase RsbU/P